MAVSNYTYAQALNEAIALAHEAGNVICADKLAHLAETMARKANAPKAPSKTQLQNRATANELYDAMPTGESVGTAWAMEHVKGVMTPQKATAIFKLLVTDGRVEKTDPVNGKVHYLKL